MTREMVPCGYCLAPGQDCPRCLGSGVTFWPPTVEDLTELVNQQVASGMDESFLVGRIIHFALGRDTRESAEWRAEAEGWRKRFDELKTRIDKLEQAIHPGEGDE